MRKCIKCNGGIDDKENIIKLKTEKRRTSL